MPHAGRPLRIGIDARKLEDYGIGTYLWHLIDQLGQVDPRNEYVLYHQFDAPQGLPQHARREWLWDGAGKYSLREQFSLAWQSWRDRLDLLHCPHYVIPLAARCPLVVTIHDLIHLVMNRHLPPHKQAYARFMMTQAVRRARRIITVSEFSRQDLIERLDAEPERVVVIPNGLPADMRPVTDTAVLQSVRRRLDLPEAFVLNVGNPAMPHKNVITLVRAWRLLRERGVLSHGLVLAGGRPEGTARQRLQAELGPHAKAVHYTGYVAREDLPALYAAADLFVWPSLYEGFGIPPLEALACGTPVVSSNVAAMPEVLGDAALLVPPLEVEAMADAMSAALFDSALRQDLRERGLRRAATFGWEAHARHTMRVYEAAAAEGP